MNVIVGLLGDRRGDGWYACVRPLMFGRWLLAINDHSGVDGEFCEDRFYDRGYEYESATEALRALDRYSGAGEPLDGWTRAFPPRFRRRPNGDPALEELRE